MSAQILRPFPGRQKVTFVSLNAAWLQHLLGVAPETKHLVFAQSREFRYIVPVWLAAMWDEFEALPVSVREEMGSERWVQEMMKPAVEAAIEKIRVTIDQ